MSAVVANTIEPVAHAPVVIQLDVPAATAVDLPDFDDEAPVAVGAVFAGLTTNAARAATPAANDPSVEREADASARGGEANARLSRVMAVRLVRARMLSGLSQGDVSKALHFKNQSQVALWERGRRLITPTALVRVSEVLGVSSDYLLGMSDEPERDQAAALRSACLIGVRKQLSRVAEITVDEVARHARLVGPHVGHVRGLLAAGDDLLEAFSGFMRSNSGAFDRMRGGATALRRAQEFETALEDARTAIRAHDALDGDLRRALADIALEDEMAGDDDV